MANIKQGVNVSIFLTFNFQKEHHDPAGVLWIKVRKGIKGDVI